MKRLAVIGYVIGLLALVVASSASAAAAPECEAQEAAARSEALGYGWSEEDADYQAHLSGEPCWEAVRAAEYEARVDQQIREEKEHEEAKEAAREKRQEEHLKEREQNEALGRAPTVTKHNAEFQTLHALHNARAWRRRAWGFVDCDGGRVNRIHWTCRIGWRDGLRVFCGAASIEGNYYASRNHGGQPWFTTSYRARNC